MGGQLRLGPTLSNLWSSLWKLFHTVTHHLVLLILCVFKAGHLELNKLSGTSYSETWFSVSQQLLAAYSSLIRLVPCEMSYCCPINWCSHCIALVGTAILLRFYRCSFLDISRRHCLTAAVLASPLAFLTFLWHLCEPLDTLRTRLQGGDLIPFHPPLPLFEVFDIFSNGVLSSSSGDNQRPWLYSRNTKNQQNGHSVITGKVFIVNKTENMCMGLRESQSREQEAGSRLDMAWPREALEEGKKSKEE